MNTPKTNLSVLAPASAYQPDSLLSFNHHNREVLRITADGRLVTGEGLSADEATQEAAKLLIASFEEQIQKMVEKRIAAERERVCVLREALRAIVRQSVEDYDERDPFCGVSLTALAALAATTEDSP